VKTSWFVRAVPWRATAGRVGKTASAGENVGAAAEPVLLLSCCRLAGSGAASFKRLLRCGTGSVATAQCDCVRTICRARTVGGQPPTSSVYHRFFACATAVARHARRALWAATRSSQPLTWQDMDKATGRQGREQRRTLDATGHCIAAPHHAAHKTAPALALPAATFGSRRTFRYHCRAAFAAAAFRAWRCARCCDYRLLWAFLHTLRYSPLITPVPSIPRVVW